MSRQWPTKADRVTLEQVASRVHAPIVVGGEELPAPTRSLVDPACFSSVVGDLAHGDNTHAEAAINAARDAFPGWSSLSATDRATAMLWAADRIEEDAVPSAHLLTRENGKVFAESRADLRGAVRNLRYYASHAERFDTELSSESDLGTVISRRQPMGPTAVIVPWNWPALLALLMLAPALIAGNTAVVKLPDFAPFALSRVLGHLMDALPKGVVNVVSGGGETVGATLTRSKHIRKVMFTGSTTTGKQILRDAAGTLKSTSIEAGGNDPAIILEDAVINDRLVYELVRAAFASSGQICYAPKRIYVHEEHLTGFVRAFTDVANDIVVGNGLDPNVTMGPLCNEGQYTRVQKLVAQVLGSSATVREVGKKSDPDTWDQGWFIRPTVVTGLDNRAELVTCEQFGPVMPILPFRTEDEGIRLANESEYGLAASVWSEDVDHAFAVGRQIEAGTVFANVHRVGASHVSMPFGGFKQSGVGRGHGYIAVEECSELQILADRQDM